MQMQVAVDTNAFNLAYKDPLVWEPDYWNFPAGQTWDLSWLGQVHRGTPWQTVYLKSGMAETNAWFHWSGSFGTHPTNDWVLPGLFTVAPNDNAARGLLGVNQTNLAARDIFSRLGPGVGEYYVVQDILKPLLICVS